MTTQQLLFAGNRYFSTSTSSGRTIHYCIRYNANYCTYEVLTKLKVSAHLKLMQYMVIGTTDTNSFKPNCFGTCIDEDIITTIVHVLNGTIVPTFANRCCVCGKIIGHHSHDHISPQCKKKLETRRYKLC